MSERVIVVGAGIIGLTCAVRLAEAGYDTQVLARDLPRETTSAVAAGLWLPGREQPTAQVHRWAAGSLRELTRLAEDESSGVRLATGTLLHRGQAALRPSWAGALGDALGGLGLDEVAAPLPGYLSGWRLQLPLVDPGRHLAWLTTRLEDAGGSVSRMALAALPQRGIVVNCSGAAARGLAADRETVAVRGQVLELDNPGMREWWMDPDEGEPLYAVPRGDRVLVGASRRAHDWGTTPTQADTQRILRRVAEVDPQLARADVRAARVGSSPVRPRVRLEVVIGGRGTANRRLVHCYGHGESGWTLAWGCSEAVLDTVRGLQPTLF